MIKSTWGALAAAAAGVLLLGGGTLAVWTSTELAPGVTGLSQRPLALLIVAIGLVGFTAAMFVAVFGKRRPRHVVS